MEDTYRHKGLRRQLVEKIREKGISDLKVLAAIENIPRHFFLEKAFEEIAYEDRAFPIGEGQTISQPSMVAYQTSLLNVKKREKILEIGTGSGYQAAVLATLGARLFTIERNEFLSEFSKTMFKKLGLINIRSYFKDGFKGLPEFAPFDKIIVTAGAVEIPKTLKDQLAIGGIMVIPVGGRDMQKMLRIVKTGENNFETSELANCKFVPFLKGTVSK